MAEQERSGGRTKYDRKAKNGQASTEAQTMTTSRSTERKKQLVPLQPVPTQLSGHKRVDLPVDVWLMIAERAHPYSILQLTRVKKSLRRIFISKELSSAIWNRAFKNLDHFPNFRPSDFGGPQLASFIYEDLCSVCNKGGTDRKSYALKIRLHRNTCEDKLMMQGRELLSKIPVIREEVLLCLPKVYPRDDVSLDVQDRHFYGNFIVGEARKVNFDLHDHLSSSKGQNEATNIRTFVEEHQLRAESMEKNGAELSVWMQELSAEERTRFVEALWARNSVDFGAMKGWMSKAIGQDWEIYIRVSLLSDQGWNELYYEIERHFLSQQFDSVKKAERQRQIKRRKLLYAKYSLLKDNDPFYPPFSIFTEIPSVRELWEPVNASNDAIEDEWDSHQLQVLDQHLPYAQRWFRLSVARTLSRSLAQLGKPLSPQLYSSLHPDNCLLPPPYFNGVEDSSNSTGLYLHDPAAISATELEDLLDRFSNQAWFFNSQQPRPLVSTLQDNLDRISQIKYQGPLFPKFNKFWHQVLSQVLEKGGIDDGPQGEVTVKLEALGPSFSCGPCALDGEEPALQTATELLKHFKHHRFPSEGIQQDSLVVFHAAEAQEDAGLVENSNEVIP
ncbi:hypothetical protein JCM5350_005270 [Sporobolomyces pararoseus]